MLRKLILLLFLFVSFLGKSQNNNLEQLNYELKAAKEDTVKIKILIKTGRQLLSNDPARALVEINKALELSIKVDIPKFIFRSYYFRAMAHEALGLLEETLFDFEKTLEYAKLTKNNSSIAGSYGNIGSSLDNLGKHKEAMASYIKGLKMYEQINDSTGVVNLNINIGTLCFNTRDLTSAKKYFNSALQLGLKIRDTAKIVIIHDNLSSINYENGDYSTCREHAFIALKLREIIKDTLGKSHSYANLASCYLSEKNYPQAIKFFKSALVIAKQYQQKASMIHYQLTLAQTLLEFNQADNALIQAKEAMQLAKELGSPNELIYAYYLLSDIYHSQKNYQEAYNNQKLYNALNDSIFTADKNKQLEELKTKYDTEKKELEISSLRQTTQIQELALGKNRVIIFALTTVAVLIILLAILFIRQNKLKANQNKMEVEQKLFRSQMNPHFIFNSLIAIQNYVYKHEPSEVAGYISSFAKLMRLILENSRNETVPIEKELAMLKYYLDLQKLRFPEKFDYEIEVDPNIDVESISIPPMLSQPFIENAIEHGIMNKTDGKGKINVKFAQKINVIEMRIIDNGVGRSFVTSKPKEEKHESLATIITNERLQILNKQSKAKFTLEIVDLKNEYGKANGTEVIICMPEK